MTVTLSRVPRRIASAMMLFASTCAHSGPSAGCAGLSGLLPGFPTPRLLSDPTRPSDMTLFELRGAAGLPAAGGIVKLYDADGSFTPGMPCGARNVARTTGELSETAPSALSRTHCSHSAIARRRDKASQGGGPAADPPLPAARLRRE